MEIVQMKRIAAIALVLSLDGCIWIFPGSADETTLEINDDEVACSDDLDCATKCVEGDTVICVDGACDPCTRITVDCTMGGTECTDNCEEGADAECDPDYLTCDACTPKQGSNSQ